MQTIDRLYQSFRAVYRAKILKKKTPLIVSWYLTDRSNAEKPCYGFPPRQEKELTSSESIEVIDQIQRAGVKRVILTGGDPLFRFDIGSIVDQLHEKGISIFMEIHGFNAERKIEILRLISRVTLPLDGPEHIHDELRYPGSYQEVLRIARLLQENNIPFVFLCTLTALNVDLVSVALEIAQHFKTGLYLQPVPPILPGTKKAHPMLFAADRMKYAMVHLRRLKKAQYPNILNSENSLTHLYHWPESIRTYCESGWISAHIDLNGDLLHCAYTRPPVVNNILKDGFLNSFQKLSPIHCNNCWEAYRYDLHVNMKWSYRAINALLADPMKK